MTIIIDILARLMGGSFGIHLLPLLISLASAGGMVYAVSEIEAARADQVENMAKINAQFEILAIEYPYSVIEFGLAGAGSDEEIIALVRKWRSDNWGAQIAAIRVLCANGGAKSAGLAPLVGAETGTEVCRIVN